MSGLAGDTGHAGHVSTVAELAVAATLDDLPVPGNDDVVHLVSRRYSSRWPRYQAVCSSAVRNASPIVTER
jgi:hypothetical protein